MEYQYNGCDFYGHSDCTQQEGKVPFGNLTILGAHEAWMERENFLKNRGYMVEVNWSCEGLKNKKSRHLSVFTKLELTRPILSARWIFGWANKHIKFVLRSYRRPKSITLRHRKPVP